MCEADHLLGATPDCTRRSFYLDKTVVLYSVSTTLSEYSKKCGLNSRHVGSLIVNHIYTVVYAFRVGSAS